MRAPARFCHGPRWEGHRGAAPGRAGGRGNRRPHPEPIAAPTRRTRSASPKNPPALYTLLTESIGTLEHLTGIEVTPILTTVKRTGVIRP
ncbi:hypothetical protein [Streptomyces sp. NPDC054765]